MGSLGGTMCMHYHHHYLVYYEFSAASLETAIHDRYKTAFWTEQPDSSCVFLRKITGIYHFLSLLSTFLSFLTVLHFCTWCVRTNTIFSHVRVILVAFSTLTCTIPYNNHKCRWQICTEIYLHLHIASYCKNGHIFLRTISQVHFVVFYTATIFVLSILFLSLLHNCGF